MKTTKTRSLLPFFFAPLALAACEIETVHNDDGQEPTGAGFIYAEVPDRDDPPIDEPCVNELPEGITKEDIDDWYNATAAIVGGEEAAQELCSLFIAGIPVAIEHSAENIPPPDANARWAWTKLRAHAKLALDPAAVEALGCGPSDIGDVLCAPQPIDPNETEFFVVTHILDDTIPIDGAELYGQYGFVFDQNGLSTDDYVADPAYPNDFYQGTDRWYQLQHYPNEGAFFGVLSATNGAIQPFPSAAKVIVKGATLIAVIPASEMEADCPTLRVTAFTHRGDYGTQAPNFWAGDTEPTVNDPLDSICL